MLEWQRTLLKDKLCGRIDEHGCEQAHQSYLLFDSSCFHCTGLMSPARQFIMLDF